MATNKMSEPKAESAQQYADFEASVMAAAERKARKIEAETQRLCAAARDELLAGVTSDAVAEHRSKVKADLRRAAAAARQDNRRRLLVYREQLVNGLFAEAAENLTAFADGPDYKAYLERTLRPLADKVSGCLLYTSDAADE